MPQRSSPEELVDSLLAARIGDLAGGAVASNIQQLRSWLDQLERATTTAPTAAPHRGPGRPRKATAVSVRPRRARRRRGRAKGGRGEFPATAFIAKAVEQAGKKGVTASEVIKQVQKATPGRHLSPSALVHTVLRRLAAKGAVKRKGGNWYPRKP